MDGRLGGRRNPPFARVRASAIFLRQLPMHVRGALVGRAVSDRALLLGALAEIIAGINGRHCNGIGPTANPRFNRG